MKPMKLLFLFAVLAVPCLASLNEEILLDAISIVETGNRDLRGKAGERGFYQLTPGVAKVVGGHDREAAHKWLQIVIADMKKAQIHICPFNIGLVYNAGITKVRRGRVPMSSYDYSTRLRNTYDLLLTKSASSILSIP